MGKVCTIVVLQVFEGCEHRRLRPLTLVAQLFLSLQPFCVHATSSIQRAVYQGRLHKNICSLKILEKVGVVSLRNWRIEVLPHPILLGSSVALVKDNLVVFPGFQHVCVILTVRHLELM